MLYGTEVFLWRDALVNVVSRRMHRQDRYTRMLFADCECFVAYARVREREGGVLFCPHTVDLICHD